MMPKRHGALSRRYSSIRVFTGINTDRAFGVITQYNTINSFFANHFFISGKETTRFEIIGEMGKAIPEAIANSKT